MENIFAVNGKTYRAKKFDFNMICNLEEKGLSIEQMGEKPLSMIRAYFCLSSGLPEELAGNEIQSHILGGGKLDDISQAMSKEMEESDFFRNINPTEKEEVAETPSKGGKKKAKAE